jgi:hypothetical protein
MTKYWYESCVGTLYSSDMELSFDEMYCSTCGDSDTYIGEFVSEEEAVKYWREL